MFLLVPAYPGCPGQKPLNGLLSVDGDADAAVKARIRIGWNKFRQLVPLLHPVRMYH